MEHLPPWLRNVPLPPRPAGGAGAGGDDDTPDWLRELQSEVAGAQAAPAEPSAPAAPPRAEPAGATDWLTGLGSGQPDEPLPPGASPVAPPASQGDEQPPTTNSRVRMPVGATEWLRSIGRDPDGKSEPLSEPPAPKEDESGVPSWLLDLSAEEVARAIESDPPPPSEPAEPDWLANIGADASTVSANWAGGTPAQEPADAGVPDWLRDVIDADAPAPGDAQRQATADLFAEPPPNLASGADVPAWLRDLGGDDPPPTPPAADDPDWLQADEPQPASLWDAAPADEVPAWLREAEVTPPVTPARETPAGDDEVPAWLREAEVTPPPVTPARETPLGEDEVPAWLREAEVSPPAAPARETPLGEDEVPAWLREAEVTPPPAAPARETPLGEDEVPAWLREAEVSPPPPQEAEPPTWLRDVSLGTPGEQAPQEAEPPTWLRDVSLGTPGEQAPQEAEPPTWLRDVEPPPPAPPSSPAADLPAWLRAEEPTPGPYPTPQSPADPGLPAWLRGVADEPPPRAEPPLPPRRAVPPPEEGESASFLKGAELPSWLRVPEPELPTESVEGQQLDWLRRLGGPEHEDDAILAPALAASALPRRQIYTRTPEQTQAIALLSGLAAAPYPSPVAAPAPAPKSALERIGVERILYALLALALIVGLLAPQLIAPFQTAQPAAPGAAELGAALDALGPEDVVLVAYEWGAQRSAELRPLEQAVIERLIAKRAKLILVSTDLQGSLLSFDLREPLRAAGYNVEPDGREFGGRDYVLLGFRPGGEFALRRIAQDLRGELQSDFAGRDASQGLVANNPDGTARISGIQDLAMILVLADQPQDVQVWMEQVRPAVRSAQPPIPMAFVLSQEALPLARPYLRLDDVYYLAGPQGALALLGSGPGAAAASQASGQLSYAVAAFLALLLVGGLIAAVAGPRASARKGGAA